MRPALITASPVHTGDSVKGVGSSSKATPTSVHSPSNLSAAGASSHRITKVLVSNIDNKDNDTTVQVFFGVRYHANGGGDNWTPIAAPVLGVGDSASYDLNVELSTSDEFVSYASHSGISAITYLVEAVQ